MNNETKRRLSSRLTKKRNKWIAIIWENESADLTQSEIGELFELKTQQVYAILKEAREAKEKEFHNHLTYKVNPDFHKPSKYNNKSDC